MRIGCVTRGVLHLSSVLFNAWFSLCLKKGKEMASKVFRVGEDLKVSDCAVVHGVVKDVSPVKSSMAGEPYYQFYLADGKKMIKGVGHKDSLVKKS